MFRIIRNIIDSISAFIIRFFKWLLCLIRGTRTCDIRFSLQGRYMSAFDLDAFGIGNDVVTIHGSALLAPSETSLADFISKTELQICESFGNYLERSEIDSNTNHLIVLDIEPNDMTGGSLRSFAPKDIGTYEGDPRQDEIIKGYKLRIRAARKVMPNAKLGLYGITLPQSKGLDSDESGFPQRMRGYQRAGRLGMYDRLDYLVPSLYTKFGPSDIDSSRVIDLDTIHSWIERSTRQGLDSSLKLKRSTGDYIPLAPFLSFWVNNNRSRHNHLLILPETMRWQLRILQEYCAVKIIVLWSRFETADEIRDWGFEPVHFNDFLTRVGEFPLPGCS